MTSTDHDRRTVLKAAGASITLAFAAGCLGNGNGNGDDDNGDGNGDEGFVIEPDTRIMLDGQTAGWEGLEPAAIDGETNPTLVLEEGAEYEIGWTEGDGVDHNIEIWDENDDVVDDLQTEWTSDPGDDQILEFTASEEMASYVCDPHFTTMIGDIRVE